MKLLPPEAREPNFSSDSESGNATAAAIAALERQLADEKDKRLQERFVYILTSLIVIDMLVFSYLENWSGPVAITVLQLVLLIVLGRMCGVEDISQLVTNMLRHAGDRMAGNKSE